MLRYCPNCKKDYNIHVKSMAEMDQMVCPVCKGKIEKESKNPEHIGAEDGMESHIGKTMYELIYLSILFYFCCGLISIVAFVFHWDKVLYIVTAVSVIGYFLQYFNMELGLIWMTVGAVAGYFIFHSVQGACLGVEVMLIIRHIIRRLIVHFFIWVGRLGSK